MLKQWGYITGKSTTGRGWNTKINGNQPITSETTTTEYFLFLLRILRVV